MTRLLIAALILAAATADARPRRFAIGQTGQVTRGLVAYWSMRNSGTTVYDEGGAYNGTATNSPTFSVANGVVGNGVSLDGTNQLIEVGDVDILNAITLTAWIRGTFGAASLHAVISKYETDGTTLQNYYLAVYQKKVRGLTRDDNAPPGAQQNVANSNQELSDDRWYHISYVWTSATNDAGTIYVDGIEDSVIEQNDAVASMDNTAIPTKIGARDTTAGSANFFQGSIDESRIYNVALTADEIKQLYRMGKTIYQNR